MAMMTQKATQPEKHVLGLSGGKDSAALAIYMKTYFPDLEIDYFFTDTGKELPEVHEFLGALEGYLEKKVLRLSPDKDFDHWLNKYNNFLPSPQTRWCTRDLKIRPFENWIKPMLNSGTRVYSYVAIRADESFREGHESTHENLHVKLPLKEGGIDKQGVKQLLEMSGVGWPKYYEWRSRSGCTFCFYQQKIEWLRLKERHPEAFEDAKTYEKTALSHGSPFSWCDGETLDELEQPERAKQIEEDYEKRKARAQAKLQKNPLRPDGEVLDMDDIFGQGKMCLNCHK